MSDKQILKIFNSPANYQAKAFFTTSELSQRISLMRHLLQYSDQVLLLMAEQGSGKTYLLEQLRAEPDEQWHLFYVQGDPLLPEQSLLQQLLNELSVNTDGKHREDLRNSLRSHIAALRYNGELPVLLVDDAHMLPLDSLQLLMNLSMQGEMQTRLRVLLACEPQISSLFSTPEFAIVQQSLIHTLDIPRFNIKQSQKYLEFRLKKGHYVGDPAFTNEQHQLFYQQSQGLPAALNQAVLKQFSATPTKHKFTSPIFPQISINKKGKFVFKVVGIILLLLLLHSLKIFWFPTADMIISDLPTPKLISPRPMPSITVKNPALETLAEIIDKNISEKPTIEIEIMAETTTDLIKNIDNFKPLIPVPQNKSGIEGVQSIEWLSRQPADFYSIQIIGAHEKNTLQKLLIQHNLDKRVPISMFKTTRDQRSWYVLTYGIYPNSLLAKQALQKLPQRLKNTGPWIRPLSDIHLLIEQQALNDGN